MSTISTRAEAVAKALWELKRAEKLATYSSIAQRAGFKPGAGGRTIRTCLGAVRRDWPHLEWWRVVADDGHIEKEQERLLRGAGFETEVMEGESIVVKSLATHLTDWIKPQDVS